MVDTLVSILGTIVILAIITTLVLPGRGTSGVLSAFFAGFATSIRAAMGK